MRKNRIILALLGLAPALAGAPRQAPGAEASPPAGPGLTIADAELAEANATPAEAPPARAAPERPKRILGIWMPDRFEGRYASVTAGANYRMLSIDQRDLHGAVTQWGTTSLLSMGYAFGNGLRIEAELGQRQNRVDELGSRIAGRAVLTSSPAGNVSTSTAMVNIAFEHVNWGLHFYNGYGLGLAWHDYSGVTGLGRWRGAPARLTLQGGSASFAWQMFGGVALPLDDLGLPNFTLMLEHRAFSSFGNARVPWQVRTTDGRVVSSGTSRFANVNHSFMLGLRYQFRPEGSAAVPQGGAPPPPGRAGSGSGN